MGKTKKPFYKRWWFVVIIAVLFIGSLLPDAEETATSSATNVVEMQIVSEDFWDYGTIYCDGGETSLKKEDYFDKNLKGNYIKWTGKVTSISDSFGSISLNVKHCPRTLTSDIIITMKDDQRDRLLKLHEGDEVTYVAKMNSFGEIFGLSATTGEIV
ncbi:hypothetical protein HOE37_02285 [Candidatus Woesearchaeota archaeon]|nr:hypothetical protein [Candidatus Woesearchaeota archaeon]